MIMIHLDVDEVLVHQGGRLVTLEALPLHDVAPVTRAAHVYKCNNTCDKGYLTEPIANAEEDHLVLAPGLLDRFRTPGVPVHWVGLNIHK